MMRRMRIMLVTHFFPPDTTPGAVRPHALACGLASLGHDVTVLTACCDAVAGEYRLVPVPYTRAGAHVKQMAGLEQSTNLAAAASKRSVPTERLVRFIARNFERLLQHPDKYKGWIVAVRRWLSTEQAHSLRPDVVLVSTPPASAAVAASELAKTWDVPMIWDQRDLWTDNSHYPYGALRRRWDRRSEQRLLEASSAIATVTQGLANRLRERGMPAPVHVIRTGICEPQRTPKGPREPGPLRLGFFGNTYGVRRDLRPVLRAIETVLNQDLFSADGISFEAWGSIDPAVSAEIDSLRLQSIATVNAMIPRALAEQKSMAADVILCPMWADDTDAVPLKVIESLAAGKTLLITGASPESELFQLVADVPGVYICQGDSDIVPALMQMRDRLGTLGTLDYSDPERRQPFSAMTMAARFAELACMVIAGRDGGP